MPDLQDRIYCSEQIHIPPTFPYIMKLYCKAAIRTQPYDLLKWSAAYFRALANGEEPPVKERVEYPPYDSPSGLTPGYIKILINQFGKDPETMVTAETLFRKWSDICLDEYLLVKLIALLGARTTVNWVNFVGVCAGFISKSLTQTMVLLCELFTEEPEGGMASVPFGLFIDLYIFLAKMDCGPLTEKEKTDMEAIMEEEDICEVADKIKHGQYLGEAAEGSLYGEDIGLKGEEETIEEEEPSEEEELEDKSVQDEPLEEAAANARKDEMKKKVAEDGAEKAKKEEENGEDEETPPEMADDQDMFDSSLMEVQGSNKTIVSEPEGSSVVSLPIEQQTVPIEPKVDYGADEEAGEVEKPEPDQAAQEAKPRIIQLEDLEEGIRAKIEEKLTEESAGEVEEEDREFEELSSYLLGAAARVQKFTAEILGFKIFRRYMRQEVPGIGPPVDGEQVEKIVNFMDVWANKQELMVMPRNIRHWMCPPLDPVPTPQP